jgi:hypothetical protein
MIGFPPTSTREALQSLLFRLAVSAGAALLIWGPAFGSSGPGIPRSEAYYGVFALMGLGLWCLSALVTMLKFWLRPARGRPPES